MAESLDALATELEKGTKGGKPVKDVLKKLLPQWIKENKRIVFNGNGYSEEWRKEAGKRGLLNLTNSVDALPELVKPAVLKAFETYKVLNGRELRARHEVAVETYSKTINVEGQLMVLMANRYILPAALKYQRDVADSVASVKAAGGTSKETKKLLDRLSALVDEFRVRTDKLGKALDHHDADVERHARYMRDTVCTTMAALRDTGDQLELLIPHQLWPLPTYREMLFIK
jgi:glutamine synthetase